MLEEILEELNKADEYLQAMKKGKAHNGDCDNVRMHIAKIQGKVNTLIITSVVKPFICGEEKTGSKRCNDTNLCMRLDCQQLNHEAN